MAGKSGAAHLLFAGGDAKGMVGFIEEEEVYKVERGHKT